MARRELKQVGPAPDGVRPGPVVAVTPLQVDASGARPRSDAVATEEPLEIRVVTPGVAERALTVTMRTPGNDFELAVGFLVAEGIVRSSDDVERVRYCVGGPMEQQFNIVTVALRSSARFDPDHAIRAFPTSSACGVCGKSSLEDLAIDDPPDVPSGPVLDEATMRLLPGILRAKQPAFDRTGGMHAAGLFDRNGELHLIREDVGRHNAVDKVVGSLVLERRFPAEERVLQVSGRASYEIMQKALMAGIPFVAAVGAPSSLAVDVARSFNMTLVGFVSEAGFNVYTGTDRVALAVRGE